MLAASSGYVDSCRKLTIIPDMDLNVRDRLGMTGLHMCAFKGWVMVEWKGSWLHVWLFLFYTFFYLFRRRPQATTLKDSPMAQQTALSVRDSTLW
jgi:hypothetical protein